MLALVSASPEREMSIFCDTRKLSTDRRAAFLDESCGDDWALRQRVQELLRAEETAGSFLSELTAEAQPGLEAANSSSLVATARTFAEPAEKEGDRIGHYRLLQQIGEGGCGVVYMAEQEEPVRRRVALKLIKLGMDTRQVIARFAAERQALALMDHPNIAKVLDAGSTATGRPYFVMELVRGFKITDYANQNRLSIRQRLELCVEVCRAVQHAHQKGIIHRDLKPSNILVTRHDVTPVPKVIDFGIAKATQGRLTDQTLFTAFEQFLGTPAYMSPEQAEMSGLEIDTRSDIYSLGVLFYELLTGKAPFDQQELLRAGLDQMRKIISETEPPRPSLRLSSLAQNELEEIARCRHAPASQLVQSLRGDLDCILMKCLEKDRARRYGSVQELGADIQRHFNDEAILASPPSYPYQLQKFVRRNKLAMTALIAVLAGLLLGLGLAALLGMWAARQPARVQSDPAVDVIRKK